MKILPLYALLLAAAAPAVSPLGLGELPPQLLAKGSCALFLWDRSSQQRIVMATAQPAVIKVMVNGVPLLLAQQEASGTAVLGFAPHAVYGETAMRIALDIAIAPSEGGGGIVRDGVVTVTGPDGSAVVAPVAGIIGCST